ncbi:MAG: hypothetical protein WBW88_05280 [Rhodothermales bacterium]
MAAVVAVAITAATVMAGESGTKKFGFDNGEIACVSPGCGMGDPPIPCCD